MGSRHLPSSIEVSRFRRFRGYQTSIIPLSGNHYFYLASWLDNPTQFPRFSNVWLVTPDRKRLLFSDPPESSAIVSIYHDFHEIHGAAISVDWAARRHLHVHCRSLDGAYEIDANLHVAPTLPSRAIVAIGSGSPTPFRLSPIVVRVSEFLLNSLVTRGGSVLLGRTETGQPFYHAETEELLLVKEGSVSLNGEELRTCTPPTSPIAFGDAVPMVKPVLKLGTMYLLFDQGMLGASA